MGEPVRPPFWRPDAHDDRKAFLTARGRIKSALRAWFEARGFTETECAILQTAPGGEAHLHAFRTEAVAPDGAASPVYLHTSPELAMKKLLAAGEKRLFEFARVFRNREAGPAHAREFTMLEWYRAQEDYDAVIADTVALIRAAARATGVERFSWRGLDADPFAEIERVSVADAFARHAGIDVLATVSSADETDRDALARACEANGVATTDNDSWSDLFAKALVEKVEPHLGLGRLTVLDAYPAPEAALARLSPDDARTAERFEVYACGLELANGSGELTDPAEQRARLEKERALKLERYGEDLPIDEDFLDALALVPPSSGVALGFDRLVMLAAGAQRIDQALWTP